MKNRLRSDDDNFSNESFLKLSHIAAYLIGNYMHHLDHLAPLASLLDIPLIIDDASLVLQAKKYYPHLKIFTLYEQSTIRNALPNLLAVITCHPKKMAQVSLFPLEHLIGHPLQPIWCPHGNSDKGAHSFFMEALADDDYLLVYGNKMIDFLRDKNALSHHAKIIQVGHYRYEYFKNNQLNVQIRLKADAKTQLLNSEKHKYRILYAPTWQPASETHLLI
ncbi:MAG: hypothetical protein K9M13_04060, partial [Simkaniaceae bacterium]|nr:hypothetical protein [Simkaniaceae bacterium]